MGANELKAEVNVANFPRISQILVSGPLKCPNGSRIQSHKLYVLLVELKNFETECGERILFFWRFTLLNTIIFKEISQDSSILIEILTIRLVAYISTVTM